MLYVTLGFSALNIPHFDIRFAIHFAHTNSLLRERTLQDKDPFFNASQQQQVNAYYRIKNGNFKDKKRDSNTQSGFCKNAEISMP